MSAPPHHCAGCTSRWNGANTAHCAGCHLTFTGLTAFDKHRTGSHTKHLYCLSPEDAGLVLSGRLYPCWGFPTANDFWEDTDE